MSILERQYFDGAYLRRHVPRWLSCKRVYLGGRYYWRFYLGPAVIDLLIRRREGFER